MSENLSYAAANCGREVVRRQQSESGAGSRKRNHLFLLPAPEGRPGGRRGSARQRTCVLPSKTHRALVLPAVGGGGARICFVKQGESELAVCVQRREECFVPGWSIVYQTTRWCPPPPPPSTPHNSSSSSLKQRNHVAQTHKEEFGSDLRCESSSQCRGLQ